MRAARCTPALAAIPLLLVACGGTTAPKPAAAAKPAAAETPASSKKAAAKKESPAAAEARLLATIANSSNNKEQAAGILSFSESRRRAELSQRAHVEPIGFRVSDLPLASIPEPLSASKAPSELPAGDDAAELSIDWRGVEPDRVGQQWTTVRVTLQGQPLGRIKIGGNEAAVAANGGGGVYVTCGGDATKGRAVISPARWETLTVESSKSARYTVVDAWFDARTCKASVVKRTTVEARPLPGGVLFGFRDSCGAAAAASDAEKKGCSERASITMLGPRLSHIVANGVGGEARTSLGSFSRVTLPIRRGGGGSTIQRVSAQSLREWQGTAASAPSSNQDVLLGVEIVQTVDDPEPIAVSYVASESR